MSEAEFARYIKGAKLSEQEVLALRKNFGLSTDGEFTPEEGEILASALAQVMNSA